MRAVTPHLLRVTLGGPDLADFESASFDDHVKVFFPRPVRNGPRCQRSARTAPSFRKANRSRSRATSRRAASIAPPASSIWNSC
ncbi:siderophore-interacting protein [Burkholderia seminalis]|uniref:siderophore-interacting protein n=1 Tax=Burkholderia seminalis TaxID=488731 RepID=UPI0034641CEA